MAMIGNGSRRRKRVPQHFPEMVAFVIAATAAPLLLDWIPPNRLYGFRIPATLASPETWYRANRLMGWYVLAGQFVAVASLGRVTAAMRGRFGGDRVVWGVPWACLLALLSIGASVVHFYTAG